MKHYAYKMYHSRHKLNICMFKLTYVNFTYLLNDYSMINIISQLTQLKIYIHNHIHTYTHGICIYTMN